MQKIKEVAAAEDIQPKQPKKVQVIDVSSEIAKCSRGGGGPSPTESPTTPSQTTFTTPDMFLDHPGMSEKLKNDLFDLFKTMRLQIKRERERQRIME